MIVDILQKPTKYCVAKFDLLCILNFALIVSFHEIMFLYCKIQNDAGYLH